ncbi:hypothetical protein BJ322DRAFT_209535 [Thelephora terrestris]|uniref:Uncharacterized protein n=1 Tax=Thelephora terrestris TaxID=56493 RepID=A0A9P6L3X6_9AGAM|nr:hypothetical protein BJ322DRAFT_209535 [Thelephora terrestris]
MRERETLSYTPHPHTPTFSPVRCMLYFARWSFSWTSPHPCPRFRFSSTISPIHPLFHRTLTPWILCIIAHEPFGYHSHSHSPLSPRSLTTVKIVLRSYGDPPFFPLQFIVPSLVFVFCPSLTLPLVPTADSTSSPEKLVPIFSHVDTYSTNNRTNGPPLAPQTPTFTRRVRVRRNIPSRRTKAIVTNTHRGVGDVVPIGKACRSARV